MKRDGVVQRGPYAGQEYKAAKPWRWPRWWRVILFDGFGFAEREIREEFLEI